MLPFAISCIHTFSVLQLHCFPFWTIALQTNLSHSKPGAVEHCETGKLSKVQQMYIYCEKQAAGMMQETKVH